MKTHRKRLVGHVTSDKMQKTVVVTVDQLKRHRLYDKVIRRTYKYKAHNPGDMAKTGDLVQIVEAQPLSREKRWAVERVLEKAVA
ncbi:MAG TPA: 30S ribosomal protein S17 [Anaerolineae bacterium]|nr:30S ribosomal protein S17 [Anaerolineae bacterium]